MKQKTLFVALFVILTCQCQSLAQTSTAQASRFVEFPYVNSSDAKASLDNFAIELQNQPGARGFIIVYRSQRDLPGLSGRLAHLLARYMILNRAMSEKDVLPVDGGVATCLVVELWVAPVGTAPKPRADAFSDWYQDLEETRKFDEHFYSLPNDYMGEGGFGDTGDLSAYLDAFGEALRKMPKATGYLIAYAQSEVDNQEETDDAGKVIKTRRTVYLDAPGTADRMLAREKNYLVNKFRIPASRIKTVKGGYRKWREMELWVVPKGEYPPVPTPTRYPKVKRR